MARYEGMEELLQRVRDRLGGPGTPPDDRIREGIPRLVLPLHEQQYFLAIDATQAIARQADALRELLSPEFVRTLSSQQHENLLAAVDGVARELWSVEGALQQALRD